MIGSKLISNYVLLFTFGFVLVFNEYPEFQGFSAVNYGSLETDQMKNGDIVKDASKLIKGQEYEMIDGRNGQVVAIIGADGRQHDLSYGGDQKTVEKSSSTTSLDNVVPSTLGESRRSSIFAEACFTCYYRPRYYHRPRYHHYRRHHYRRHRGCGYCGKRRK